MPALSSRYSISMTAVAVTLENQNSSVSSFSLVAVTIL